MTLRYRVSHTIDPEERLEDAAMAKAMRDALGVEIVAEGEADFGRDKMFGGPRQSVAYWRDPAFLANAGRSVEVHDFGGARKAVEALHRKGRGAFVKAIDLKLFASPVPIGTPLEKAIGDLVWSVLDRPNSIMVQPLCDVRYEMRFVSVGRAVVTSSPVAWHLTPISRIDPGYLFETPRSEVPLLRTREFGELHRLAQKVARECEPSDVIIDCAMIDGQPGVIEFNPFSIGNFGLYACDPFAIAKAFAKRAAPQQEGQEG